MDLPTTDSFGDRIKLLVRREGSRRALSRKLGVSDGTIVGWEGGVQPYQRNLEQIAQKCGVDLDWLITGHGPAPSLEEINPDTALRESPAGEGVDAARLNEDMETYASSPAHGLPDILETIADGMSPAQIAAAIQRLLSNPRSGTERARAAQYFTEYLQHRLREQNRATERRN